MSAAPVRAIVLADGHGSPRAALDAAWPGWSDGASIVVAADGGAELAAPLGLHIDRWVGDGDSLAPSGIERLRASGVDVSLAPTDKDESDTELAVLAAVDAGATDLTILGALGGARFDHALANVALLAHPALAGRAARLLGATARVTLLAGPASEPFTGGIGDLVSLLPLSGDVEGVATEGLEFPLHDEPLRLGPARGLSNRRTADVATVSIRTGRLLVIETPARLPP
jgi:thiamine pyrophosphokinase